jgi:ABC-2 type transport system permease protein
MRMRETWVIAKRELLERVRTKWFVVITILGPILLVGLIVVPALLAGRGSKGATIDIVDQSLDGKVGPLLVTGFATDDEHWRGVIVPTTTSDDDLRARVDRKEISGFIRIPPNALTDGTIVYRGDNATNQMVKITLKKTITLAVIQARGVDPSQLRAPNIETSTREGQSGEGTFLLGYIIAFILYMVITLYGVNVMRSVVTEKSSRVMELMVASAKPRSLMAGKVLGVGGAGLLQITIWFGIAGLALANRDTILGWFHVSASGSFLPSLSIGDIAVIVVFFLLGYLFYSSLFAAIGATVSSEQDSQQAQLPITMLLVIAMVSMTAITGEPRGGASVVMTQIPCWSPILMPLRFLLGGATPVEVALSIAILLVSTVLVTRAAAKIYRVGILMYGKRPGLGELVRWLRH